jgi:hypothetical protein
MKSNLTNNDYISILNYYKKPIPNSKNETKTQAEKIMANKLCKCIKKIDKRNEAKSIRICTKTLFQNRGFSRGRFQCKNKNSVTFKKNNKRRSHYRSRHNR